MQKIITKPILESLKFVIITSTPGPMLFQVMAVLAQNVDNVKKLFLKTVELLAEEKWDETIRTNQVGPTRFFHWAQYYNFKINTDAQSFSGQWVDVTITIFDNFRQK
jgi:hypothetical protein